LTHRKKSITERKKSIHPQQLYNEQHIAHQLSQHTGVTHRCPDVNGRKKSTTETGKYPQIHMEFAGNYTDYSNC